MIYQHIVPDPALSPFVDKYLLIHYHIAPSQSHAFKAYPARPEHYMTFTPIGTDTRTHTQTGLTENIAPNAIFSQAISRYDLHPSSDFLLFRIYFRPGALFRLFGIPLNKFTDTFIETDSLIAQDVRIINEQLGNASGYPEMTRIVESFSRNNRMKKYWVYFKNVFFLPKSTPYRP